MAPIYFERHLGVYKHYQSCVWPLQLRHLYYSKVHSRRHGDTRTLRKQQFHHPFHVYKNILWLDVRVVGIKRNHQLFHRYARMAFLAVLAEEILPILLVFTISAAYCRWSMYRLDVPLIFPFARKALAAVVEGTSKLPSIFFPSRVKYCLVPSIQKGLSY